MKPEFYITDEQIAKAREKGACDPALTWAEKERDWRNISPDWLEWDAQNTKMCSAKVLAELSRSEDTGIRCSVAQHQNTSTEVLTDLSKDLDWPVRAFVAENSNTPVDVLLELSKDNDSDVRYSAISNLNTPAETLVKIAVEMTIEIFRLKF